MVKDGWHNLREYAVYTENNKVMHAYYWDAFGEQIPVKPFHWDGKNWVDVTGKCTIMMLYSGLKRDTYALL